MSWIEPLTIGNTTIDAITLGNNTHLVRIGSEESCIVLNRSAAEVIRDYLSRWLAYDPDTELVEKINHIRVVEGGFGKSTIDIIAAVREHDKEHGQ